MKIKISVVLEMMINQFIAGEVQKLKTFSLLIKFIKTAKFLNWNKTIDLPRIF